MLLRKSETSPAAQTTCERESPSEVSRGCSRPFLLAPYACVLSPLIEAGVLAQVLDEGVPETVAMVAHPLVSHVHGQSR